MSTQAGIPCPDCEGNEKTKFQALKVNAEGRMYAVGVNCYRKQWAEVYGKNEKCPV